MYRKYCVGTTISAQSISMFGTSGITNMSLGSIDVENTAMAKFNSTILSNCSSKVFTGGAAPIDELQWWQKEIGQWKRWQFQRDFQLEKGETGKLGDFKGVKFDYTDKVKAGTLQFLADEACAYKIISDNGKPQNSDGVIEFMASKYKEPHKGKTYNFSKYSISNGVVAHDNHDNNDTKKHKKKNNFEDDNDDIDIDPIKSTSNSNYLLNNEDAIIVKLDKKDDKNS